MWVFFGNVLAFIDVLFIPLSLSWYSWVYLVDKKKKRGREERKKEKEGKRKGRKRKKRGEKKEKERKKGKKREKKEKHWKYKFLNRKPMEPSVHKKKNIGNTNL